MLRRHLQLLIVILDSIDQLAAPGVPGNHRIAPTGTTLANAFTGIEKVIALDGLFAGRMTFVAMVDQDGANFSFEKFQPLEINRVDRYSRLGSTEQNERRQAGDTTAADDGLEMILGEMARSFDHGIADAPRSETSYRGGCHPGKFLIDLAV